MSMKDFKALMNTGQYDFLRKEERLGKRIILLGLGGSYAYGTYQENSDIDFRGITLNMTSDLLGLTEFEQYEDDKTDTVIYSFNKMVKLLLECNPNTCEILGLEEEQYLIKTKLGQELLDQKGLFLSKRAAKVLRRLCGRAAQAPAECYCQGRRAPEGKGKTYPEFCQECPGGF